MEWNEDLTSTGRGRWGYHPVTFALSTVTRRWYSRRGPESQSSATYRLTYLLDDDEQPTTRDFLAVAERDALIAASITERKQVDDGDKFPLIGYESPLGSLAGDTLTAVYFIRDYFQLVFDHRHTSFFAWPIVSREGSTWEKGQSGYRDVLCSFIDDQVIGSDAYLDDGVVVEFTAGELRIPAETIRSFEHGPEVVWGDGGAIMAGETPFE